MRSKRLLVLESVHIIKVFSVGVNRDKYMYNNAFYANCNPNIFSDIYNCKYRTEVCEMLRGNSGPPPAGQGVHAFHHPAPVKFHSCTDAQPGAARLHLFCGSVASMDAEQHLLQLQAPLPTCTPHCLSVEGRKPYHLRLHSRNLNVVLAKSWALLHGVLLVLAVGADVFVWHLLQK